MKLRSPPNRRRQRSGGGQGIGGWIRFPGGGVSHGPQMPRMAGSGAGFSVSSAESACPIAGISYRRLCCALGRTKGAAQGQPEPDC